MQTNATNHERPLIDAAIRHMESVHRVIVAKRQNAKVIPFPPRYPKPARAPA